MSKLCLNILTLFLCDAPALSNRNTSAKGTETRQCGWLIGAALPSMFFHFGKKWLSPYWSAFYIHSSISFPFFIFTFFKQTSWTGNADTTFFFFCMTSTMDMYISLSKEIIKHPFATCPGSHSCCVYYCTHPHRSILVVWLKPCCGTFQPINKIQALIAFWVCLLETIAAPPSSKSVLTQWGCLS